MRSLRLFGSFGSFVGSFAIASILAGCSGGSASARSGGGDATSAGTSSALHVTGRVADLSSLDNAEAIALSADDDTTVAAFVDPNGAFALDLPSNHLFRIILANTTRENELEVVAHLANHTSRGKSEFFGVQGGGSVDLGVLGTSGADDLTIKRLGAGGLTAAGTPDVRHTGEVAAVTPVTGATTPPATTELPGADEAIAHTPGADDGVAHVPGADDAIAHTPGADDRGGQGGPRVQGDDGNMGGPGGDDSSMSNKGPGPSSSEHRGNTGANVQSGAAGSFSCHDGHEDRGRLCTRGGGKRLDDVSGMGKELEVGGVHAELDDRGGAESMSKGSDDADAIKSCADDRGDDIIARGELECLASADCGEGRCFASTCR
jgi:hypothetical protein